MSLKVEMVCKSLPWSTDQEYRVGGSNILQPSAPPLFWVGADPFLLTSFLGHCTGVPRAAHSTWQMASGCRIVKVDSAFGITKKETACGDGL